MGRRNNRPVRRKAPKSAFTELVCIECRRSLHHMNRPRTCFTCDVDPLCGSECLAAHRTRCM